MTSQTATAEIERLAREAPAGPWHDGFCHWGRSDIYRYGGEGSFTINGKKVTYVAKDLAPEVGAYIAAVSPDVVLGLIADWRDERRRADSLLESLDKSQAERERLLAALRAAEAERDGLREEIGGALHDMGKDGHSICNYSKALLRLAYGDDPENELEYTLAEATASVISSDEMHGKRSPLRDRAALQSTSAKEGE